MGKLIFSQTKNKDSIGYIGGGVEMFPEELWRKIPDRHTYQTHLFTLYPEFYHDREAINNFRISVFISLELHALGGGVKRSLTDKFTVHENDELGKISNGYAYAVIYNPDTSISEYNFGDFDLPRKYFSPLRYVNPEYEEYSKKETECFEETGMGLAISKYREPFYFEQDPIVPPPKYSELLQLLQEDIEKQYHIFQDGIGYFYLNRNIKKLKHGDQAGVFFIQNT